MFFSRNKRTSVVSLENMFMRIKYAVSTMVFWWREHHLSFEQECDYLKSLGFGVELYPTIKGHDDCRYAGWNWSRLREATRDMLVSLKSRSDGPTLEEWAEQIKCAEMLGGCVVANLQSLCISESLGIADWGFASDVVNIAKEHDVMLCVETGSLGVVLKAGEKFDSIRYCIDTGFANIDSKAKFVDYVDRLAERTTYVHLTDNYGRLDDHEPPGVRGGMVKENWGYLLESLSKYDNDVIGAFEMCPCMPGTMIEQGSRFLFDVIGWPNQPEKAADFDRETAYRPL